MAICVKDVLSVSDPSLTLDDRAGCASFADSSPSSLDRIEQQLMHCRASRLAGEEFPTTDIHSVAFSAILQSVGFSSLSLGFLCPCTLM